MTPDASVGQPHHRGIEIPAVQPDFQAPDFVIDPYPLLTEIRQTAPVTYDEGSGHYLISDYEGCARMLGDAEAFASDKAFFVRLFGGETMECMERDRHVKVRGIWTKDFRRPVLRDRNTMISEVVFPAVDEFAARIRDGETIDACEEMIRAIPTRIIATMMGIPDSDYRQFAQWSDLMAGIGEGRHDPTPHGAELVRRGEQATAELNGYIADRIKGLRARDQDTDDLMGHMLSAPASSEMSEQEIIASNTQLVFAGNETTAKLLATTMQVLGEHPDQLALLRQDRSLLQSALEEIHRWQSVVHLAWRFVRGTQRVGEVEFQDGDTVVCLQGGANRDEARWEHPDRLDITRTQKPHFGYGFGMHMCIGIHLARIESEIWLNRMLDQVPDWKVDKVEWGTDWVVRGPVRLAVGAA